MSYKVSDVEFKAALIGFATRLAESRHDRLVLPPEERYRDLAKAVVKEVQRQLLVEEVKAELMRQLAKK